MRRFKQELSKEECEEILRRNTSGVLAVIGDDGFPYGVPLNYSYNNDKIIFHSATKGHKNDALEKCNKVSFTVIDKDEIIPSERTSYFRSVICFGIANKLDGEAKMAKLLEMTDKYSSDYTTENIKEANMKINVLEVFEIDILHMSGKEAIELTRKR